MREFRIYLKYSMKYNSYIGDILWRDGNSIERCFDPPIIHEDGILLRRRLNQYVMDFILNF